MVKDNKLIGMYLIFDAVVSIYLASIGNITLTLASLTADKMLLLGQIGKIIRLWIGLYILGGNKINNKLVGGYLIFDAIISMVTAREFNSWDDYLRVSRAYVGWRLTR